MIIGAMTIEGDAVVPVRLRGLPETSIEVRAAIDTGFTEQISLPEGIIRQLGLNIVDEADLSLADGTIIQVRVFSAEVFWLGSWRRVNIAQVEGMPLIGLGLLRGCRLVIEVIEGGRVVIEKVG